MRYHGRVRERGSIFSETIISVALIGIAVFIASSLLNAHPRVSARLAARQDVVRALDAAVEGLRAGALPLESGPIAPLAEAPRTLRLTAELRPLTPAGLYEVELEAWCSVRGSQVREHVVTRIWRPQ